MNTTARRIAIAAALTLIVPTALLTTAASAQAFPNVPGPGEIAQPVDPPQPPLPPKFKAPKPQPPQPPNGPKDLAPKPQPPKPPQGPKDLADAPKPDKPGPSNDGSTGASTSGGSTTTSVPSLVKPNVKPSTGVADSAAINVTEPVEQADTAESVPAAGSTSNWGNAAAAAAAAFAVLFTLLLVAARRRHRSQS